MRVFQQHGMPPHLGAIDLAFIFLAFDRFLTFDHTPMLFVASLEFACF